MKTASTSTTSTSSKQSTADIIASQFIEALEKGVVPWQKPWVSIGFQNLVSKKKYRGINTLMLAILGGGDSYFLTFNQIKALKGTLLKGSKSIPICFYSPIESKKEKDSNGKPKKFFMLRYYRVFRASQVEGIKIPETKVIDFSPIEAAEKLAALNSCPIVHASGNEAAYYPSLHKITMPNANVFKSESHYYATLFHEIGHSLKGESGDDGKPRNTENYSFEELCAEIFSALCINHCGLFNENLFDNSASYIGGWLEALKNDPSMILKAAGQAQKRFDSLLGVKFTDSNDTDNDNENN